MFSLFNSPIRIATILLFAITFNSNIVLATSHANKLLTVSEAKQQETSAEQTWDDNEDDDWADDWSDEEQVSSPWQLTGFVEAAYGQFLQDNIVENSATINAKCFIANNAKTDVHKHSFFIRTVKDWNKLSNNQVTSSSVDIFKTRLHSD